MQKIKLTQELVKKLKAGVMPYDVRDSVLQSFGVRVYPSGRKTYFIQAQNRRRRTWEALGGTYELTTANARKMAFGKITQIKEPVVSGQFEAMRFEDVGEMFFDRCSPSAIMRQIEVIE